MAADRLDSHPSRAKHGQWLFRWVIASALLTIVLLTLDLKDMAARLSAISPVVWLLALGITVFQVWLSAWRWRYTARQLGVIVPPGFAFREYYLASFVNQVLPGGVMGDVNRAWRHGRAADRLHKGRSRPLAIVHAVILERLSGQLVLFPVAALALMVLWFTGHFGGQASDLSVTLGSGYWIIVPGLLAMLVLLAVISGLGNRLQRYAKRLAGDVGKAFFGWQNVCLQFGASLLVLGTYMAIFGVMAVSMFLDGDSGQWWLTLLLCPLLLVAMVVPVTVSGWGVREGVAAILWPLAGLSAEQGVALSVGYGAAVFIGSLPGSLMLLRLRPPAS